MSLLLVEIGFNALCALAALGAGLALRREPTAGRALALLVALLACACAVIVVGGALLGLRWQTPIRLLAWALFAWGPVATLGAAALLRRAAPRAAIGLAAAGLAVVAVGVDAFLIEPRALEVNTVRLARPEVSAPLKIALVADLQTTRIGEHERRALQAVAEARPDLILWSGDYLQLPVEEFEAQSAALRALILELGLTAPLGSYAVEGDVDTPLRWVESFAGTPVEAITESQSRDLGPLVLTLLTPDDSRAARLDLDPTDKLRVVVGHAPDFSLGRPDADVLLAGHIHGGQVQLPLIGPLRTLSAVPRDQADGHTRLPWGADLIVSRGIGMERGNAPPLRFLCRPEVVIVEIVPAT